MRGLWLMLFLVLVPATAGAQSSLHYAHWVQIGPGGAAEARAAVAGKRCPDIAIDGVRAPMIKRAAAGDGFPLICSAPLPAQAKSAWLVDPRRETREHVPVTGVASLPLPVRPARILVIGDTGCRIKGGFVQACNDPAKWPFPVLAKAAARLKPDLVIHVGDYLYRESACPPHDRRCKGSPSGDNWQSWDADFFSPAKPLLDTVPFIFVRGNHEECARAGRGWLRLMGPLPFVAGQCGHLAPYAVPLGAMTLAVMDDANAPDIIIDHNLIDTYRADFSTLSALGPAPIWLAMHRPLWGAVSRYGFAVGGNRTLIAALDPAQLRPVTLMLSGHIHAFEALNYRDALPPQLIAGNSGDKLDTAPSDLSGANLSGETVKDGISLPGFGFLLMTAQKNAWRIDVHRADGTLARICRFAGGRIDCPEKTQPNP